VVYLAVKSWCWLRCGVFADWVGKSIESSGDIMASTNLLRLLLLALLERSP